MESSYVIRAAQWPLDLAAAGTLLRSYAAYLASGPNGADPIDTSGLAGEVESLSQIYCQPQGTLFLASAGNAAIGCAAVKQLNHLPGAYEMKRLWTEPAGRGVGVGRALAEEIIAWTRERNGSVLLLDTQPKAMPQAVALYRSLGFEETARYNDNPVSGLLFMELRLR